MMFHFHFQIGLVTQYWTKFNVIFLIISVILFFIITKITQGPYLFQMSPKDYLFIGMILLEWLIVGYFQPSLLRELLYLG